jgi:hypothetical protein
MLPDAGRREHRAVDDGGLGSDASEQDHPRALDKGDVRVAAGDAVAADLLEPLARGAARLKLLTGLSRWAGARPRVSCLFRRGTSSHPSGKESSARS